MSEEKNNLEQQGKPPEQPQGETKPAAPAPKPEATAPKKEAPASKPQAPAPKGDAPTAKADSAAPKPGEGAPKAEAPAPKSGTPGAQPPKGPSLWEKARDKVQPVTDRLTRTYGVSWMAVALAVVLLLFCGVLSYGVSGPAVQQTMAQVEEPEEIAITLSSYSFVSAGTFRLAGLEQFSVEDLEENLTFQPGADFTAEKETDGRFLITMENHKNLAYEGSFLIPGDQEAGTKDVTVSFTLNGPPMTVRISGSSANVYKYGSLELVFSEQVDIYSLEENLQIEPRTAYTLAYDLNKVTITPTVEWITTNNYQIKISADYKSKIGRQFSENQVLSFKVPIPPEDKPVNTPPPSPYVNFRSSRSYVLNGDAEMALLFNAEHLKNSVPVLVETYRMDSLEKYREQGHVYLDYDVPLDSMELLDTNAFLIQNGENRFTVPTFGNGIYFLSAKYTSPLKGEGDREVRTSFFVTPLSVYMQSSNKETIVWLNSSEEAAPLSGYEVALTTAGDILGVTDNNGMLIVPHDKGENRQINFSVRDGDGTLVYYDNTNLHLSRYQNERYYSYMFLDRTLYKPEDTVCFWGFVQPFRYNERELPETVQVTFDQDGLDIMVEVPIDENGVYYGEIELEQIRSSQYAIQSALYFPPPEDAEEGAVGTRYVLETEYVSVKNFEKPTFVLESSYDKDYYGPNDTVKVTVTASFYDGTPLPYYPLEVSYYHYGSYSWNNISDNIQTDSSGTATFTFPANKGGRSLGDSKGLSSNQYMVQIANDGEQVTHVKNYRYFPSDTLIEASIEPQNDENLQLTVRTYALDMESQALAEYMASNQYYYGLTNARLLEIARGEPVDVALNMDIHWSYFDQRGINHRNRQSNSSGSYIQFENYYSLDYETVTWSIETIDDWETMAKKISVTTTDGVAVVPEFIYLREDTVIDFDMALTSRAHISYTDGLNNNCLTDAYYPSPAVYNRYMGDEWMEEDEEDPIVPGYSFAITNLSTGEDITPVSRYYYYGMALSVDAGTRYGFQLLEDSQPVETGGRLMYTIIQDGLYQEYVTDLNSFDLEYLIEYGKNIRLVAAYFNGAETYYVKQYELNATTNSMTVNLEVTPDQASYRPGDQVTLQVRATDYLGQGVPGSMCVAVVDESIFALSEQQIDVLWGLYSDLMYMDNYVSLYCTTYRDVPESISGGDGGKGGDGRVEFYDSYRSNFKDTALFFPTTTDANGNATVQFELPDNTTSWRITAVQVGDNLRAGDSKSNIISSLPFFCKPVLTTKYIEGDDIAMLVQGHGTLLADGDEISYTVTITGDDVDLTLTAEDVAYQAVEFNFGKLPIGDYTVVSQAQYSGYSDTVELPLSVIKSNLELVVSKAIDVSEGIDINAVRYPVTLSFYDRSNEPFMTSIRSLFGHYCMQANQRMSRFVAKRVVRQTVEGGGRIPYYISEGNDYVSDMQNYDGGIGYTLGGDSDPLVTTYVMLVAKDNFNLRSMSRYYQSQLETLKDEKKRAACYLGLAAIGDISAGELLELLNDEGNELSVDVQAYLIAGLGYLGETETARSLYVQRLRPSISNLSDGRPKDLDWERDAAAVWIAASLLHSEDADALSLHFGKNVWRYRTLFECMIYTVNYDRMVTSTSFSYTVKGQTTNVNLGIERGMKTLVLSKSDLESLEISGAPDTLTAVAYYVGEPSEIGLEQSEMMSIEKSIAPLDDITYEVTLKIHLEEDAPTGQYDISDWVPSNTRLYGYSRSYTVDKDISVGFRVTEEGQNLYIAFDSRAQTEQTILFKYKVRQTFQSESALDTAYMMHGESGENCNTEKDTFKPDAPRDGHQVVSVSDQS